MAQETKKKKAHNKKLFKLFLTHYSKLIPHQPHQHDRNYLDFYIYYY